MKYSIKRQMMTVFVGLILFMIVVFMIVNGSFLEKYYISNKKSEFIKAYTMVQKGVENGTIDSETPEKDLGRFTEKNNISIAVIDSEYNVVYTNVREKQMMAISYGPENVLMIVGMNKIVRSAEDAYARAKYVAAPINGQRFEGLPCAKTGVCSNCKSPKSICCQTLITRFSHVPNRIKVILVNEELGF